MLHVLEKVFADIFGTCAFIAGVLVWMAIITVLYALIF